MRLFVVIVLFAAIGCANSPHDECGGNVLILWPTAAGAYKFQEIQLSTLKSPYELKGAAAEIYYDSRMTDKGYEGPIARPNLIRSKGGVCVPADVASSVSLTTYAHIEHLYKFDQKLAVDHQVSWPRKVGVDIRLRTDSGISHSNAHYFGRSDAMAVVPYNGEMLPLGLNPGILAHEHFHAHFQTQVNNVISETISSAVAAEEFFYMGFGIKPVVEDLMSSLRSVENLNKFVLRSWNEGLADLYGAIYTGQSDFFSSSIDRLGPQRDLSGTLWQLKGSKELAQDAVSLDPARRDIVSTSYKQGTLLARMMYQIAVSGSIAPEALLKQVLERLPRVSALATPALQKRVMDFEEIVPPLLEGLTLNPTACKAIQATLSKELLHRSFSQCGI